MIVHFQITSKSEKRIINFRYSDLTNHIIWYSCSILTRLRYHGFGCLDSPSWMWGCNSRTGTCVQREMDKDMICFFNLMEFVEEYGYTSIDYLYYKRRDSLVAIEWDSNVMEMLKDNETTKEVSLFVTKQRMAIMASKSKKASTKSAPTKTKRSMIQLTFTHFDLSASIPYQVMLFF